MPFRTRQVPRKTAHMIGHSIPMQSSHLGRANSSLVGQGPLCEVGGVSSPT